ncbi:putative Ig domain-containing protein [Kitasatospora viridis]|uniref:Serine protease n=1 Tax=Kitasatospora viridis TaxID=281105 RepID=A0A561UBW7_9ACTN|nr:putative Ig domain-containing protein [Kitasatospora viridis]TWF96854.1 serine protease [Kitasatospora viridis]
MGTPHIRARAAVTGLAALSLVTGVLMAAAAPSATAAPATSQAASANPYDPATGHSYRHGVIPTIQQNGKMKTWAAGHASPQVATGPETLSYGGGVNGVGVNDGHAKVYLVFYGSQWGTQGTDSNGNATFTGDPDGAAAAAQQMFKGIGTNNELWSADLTQWCDGPNVASGATSCPSNASFVPYQTGGVLSGVWEDTSSASPSAATGNQLGQEAVNAAAHFGNTASGSNRNTYYVILSPTGANPDNYQGQYCAWHDYTGDSSLTGGAVSSPYGDLAFSNQPYNMDSGQGCGVGFVNSPGTLDGWTITLGHEWHEMMSDMYPAGGWTNQQSGSSFNGQENSDECAWIAPGTTGGAANVSFGSFGTYPEQASWSNDTNACSISHPILNHGGGTGNTVTVTNPGSQSGTVGTAVSLQVNATDSGSGQTLTYSATGLPAGLSISSSGLITGTPTTAATSSVTVTATDGTGASGSASFSWTIATSGGGGTCTGGGQLLGNPGFETGAASPWTATAGVINNDTVSEPAHSGNWDAWLDGYGAAHTDTLSQTVNVPANCSASFSFWLHIDTAKTGSTASDKLTVTANGTTIATFSNLNANNGYVQETYNLSSYAGKSVTLKFSGVENSSSAQTSFVIDDTALNAS